ncbi:proteinase-activated receptor 1-like [Brachionichthys hirsutus]|uniref:proteinase-activated receptor 1-like n=1 Tax=Brachionichthys hirsutus TaxID=412623 RepID=UPI0036052772
MFLLCLKCFLLLLVCARSAGAGTNNGSAQVRTFALFDRSATDEPIPPDLLSAADGVAEVDRAAGRGNATTSSRARLSDDALLFLTGPVSTVLIPSFYSLVCLVSVPINLCAVLAFARRIQPKKPAAIYMLNLACADLLFALLLPLKISYHFGGNNWMFGAFVCRVVTAAFYWNMYCSVLLIACIAVDRLLAVAYPIDSLAWRRPRNSIVACLTAWTLSLAGSVPLVLAEQTVHLGELDITTCHDIQDTLALIGYYKVYFIALCCAFFFLPLLVTVASYARVIWTLSRVPPGVPGRSRRRTRAVVMAVTVLVMFVLCFTPTNCLLLAHYLQFGEEVLERREAPDGSYVAYLVFTCVGSLNCLLDPLLYYFGSSQCQRQLSRALRCKKNPDRSHSSQRSSSRTDPKSKRTESSTVSSQYKKLLI